MPRTLALSKVTPLLLFLKLVAAVAIAATSCAYSVFAGADWQLKRIVSYDFQQADYNLSCDGVSWNLSDAYRLSPLSLVIRSDADFTFPPDLYAYWSDDGATKLGIPIFCTIGLAPADPDVPCCGNTDIQVQVVTPLRHNSFVTVDGCMNLFPTYLDDVLLHSPSHRYVILEIDPTGDPSPSNNRLSVEVVPPCPPLEFTPFYQGAAVYPPLDLRVPLTFGASGGCTTVKSGCALCATASMLTSFGINTTPVSLNSSLLANDGWEGCKLDWQKIQTAVNSQAKFVEAPVMDEASIGSYLNEHHCKRQERIIVRLKEFVNEVLKNDGEHFVLVTGKNGNDWNVFDPGWRTANPIENLSTLQGHIDGFTKGANNLRFEVAGVITFASGSGSFLGIQANCPIEILIRDPEGRILGRDPQTGNNVFGIPGGSYFMDSPIVDDDGDGPSVGDLSGIKTALIPTPIGGTYKVEVTGTGAGSYRLDFQTVWTHGSGQMTNYSGVTDVGVKATNSFFVITPPLISNMALLGNVLSFSFTTQTGVTYQIEQKTTLEELTWMFARTVAGDGTAKTFSQTNSSPSGFYRVRVP